MEKQTVKVHIKVGDMELSYEGDSSFLTGGIETLLSAMGEIYAKAPDLSTTAPNIATESHAPIAAGGAAGIKLSTNSIANHYGAKSASDLALCAIIQLQLVQGVSECSRDDVLSTMKTANNYYKASMKGGNLTKAIKVLVNNKKINELAGGKYSLTATERQNAEAQLAAIG